MQLCNVDKKNVETITVSSQSSLKKAEYKLEKKLIKTLPLYIVSIKTLYHICKNNAHTQIVDNLSSK